MGSFWCKPAAVASKPPSEVVLMKLVKPLPAPEGNATTGAPGSTGLCSIDVFIATVASARAWGFSGKPLDASALESALQATVTDLPFLAGRYAGLGRGSAWA